MKIRLTRLGIVLAIATTAGGCVHRATSEAPASPSVSSASLPGCYRLTVGTWSGDFPSRWPAAHQPPTFVYLDTTVLPPPFGRGDVRRLSPNNPAFGTSARIPPGWYLRGDSLHLYWSTGFAGVRVAMHPHGDTLRGRARAFHDVVGPGIIQPTAAARMWREPCP